jgi:hypothetical protein
MPILKICLSLNWYIPIPRPTEKASIPSANAINISVSNSPSTADITTTPSLGLAISAYARLNRFRIRTRGKEALGVFEEWRLIDKCPKVIDYEFKMMDMSPKMMD